MTNQNDNGYAWLQCKCCPYGYHIDLDFVRYCESIGQQQVERTGSIKRRRDRRRQRQSMEVLLGLTPIAPVIQHGKEPLLTPIADVHVQRAAPQPPPSLTLHIHDELSDVVKDFERTLQRSKNKLSNNLPDVTAVSGDGSSHGRDFDSVSIESSTTSSTCGLSAAALQAIREQMALSLERTRELEDLVRALPALQAQIATLEDENRQLVQQLRSTEEENNLNRLNSNYLCNGQRHRSSSFDDTIDNLQRKVPPPPPPRRDFGVTAGVLTRNIGVGHQTHTKNAATATLPDRPQQQQHVDRWYNEKSRFLNGGDYIPPPVKNTHDSSAQTITPPSKQIRNVSVQTIDAPRPKRNDSATQVDVKPLSSERAVNAVVATTHNAAQVTPRTRAAAVSDDTIDDLICTKCRARKTSVGVNTNLTDLLTGDTPAPVSLATLTSASTPPRSKSFHLGEGKLNLARVRSVASQYEWLMPPASSKSSQTETKTASKLSQHDPLPIAHKSVQYEHVGQTKGTNTPARSPAKSKSTDTSGLAPAMLHKACEVSVKRSATAEAACNTDAVKEAPTRCAKCSSREADDAGRKEEVGTTSRIPRLQQPTTPVENRTYRRQDTYTKISASAEKSPTGLTALELATKSIAAEVSPIDKVKQKYKLPEPPTSTPPAPASPKSAKNGPTQPTTTTSTSSSTHAQTAPTLPSSSSVPESALCQPSSPRKKCVPSKEMQAAMKVLNDSLQKYSGRDVRGAQMKNANAVIEQEWFRISSVVHADPLDVEDYLDAFEDVSGPLLQYIVNMVDTSGNTAMHYAVSHGNFDVVSILLDSKVCDINRQNKAGYTSVMLVSLAEVRSHTHANVVRRLFSLADVNIRAKQHGQTALMLAVSHGRLDMVAMLLEAGADINIQDEDGSTALMCAAEHGHVEIVKHFLSQPDCDSSIKDVDGSMALQIAMEAGHRHIGVLLYAHNRNQHGESPPIRPKKSKSTSASPKMPSSPLMQRSVNRALPTNK